MPFQFARFNKRFATLFTNMNPGSMGVQMFSHGTAVMEDLVTTIVLANE